MSVDYKRLVIEKVEHMENERILQFIYELIISFQKKWGI